MSNQSLLGIGLYTPVEASRLLKISSAKIARWLRGHEIKGKRYEPLWTPQISLPSDGLFLGFRDLMELRAVSALLNEGVSAISIRKAIVEARNYVEDERPLSTLQFRTDGRGIFLEIASDTGDEKLLDLLNRQYAFKKLLEMSLRNTDFDGTVPARWWPAARQKKILVDPERSFGQPIDVETGVPTAALSAAAKAEGSVEKAAKLWIVPVSAVRRAVAFERDLYAQAA